MAKKAKTQSAAFDLAAFLAGVEDARRAEADHLVAIFASETGFAPRMWGPMVGFGRYDYVYDSGHAGQSLVVGFAPRKAELSLYGLTVGATAGALLARLGPHRLGKGSLYLRRLAAVDETVLRALIRAGVDDTRARWPVHPA